MGLADGAYGAGAGPAVVGIHGLASAGVAWRPALEPLTAAGARLWLPDLLGFGRSPWPEGAAYDVATHIGALDGWAAGALPPGEPLVLAGTSLGAVLAAEWAARLPAARVRAVVLVSVPLYDSAAGARAGFAASDPLTWLTVRHPRLAAALCRRTCGPAGLATRATRAVLPHPWHGERPAWQAFPEAVFLHSWTSLSRTLERCLVEHRVQPTLRTLAARGTPLVFVHGGRDRLAPAAPVRRLAAETGARLVFLPRADHGLPLTHGPVLAGAVRHAGTVSAVPSALETP